MVNYTSRVLVKFFKHEPMFLRQNQQEVSPSLFAAALKQCCNMRDMEYGKRVHEQMIEHGLEADTFLSNILVEFYRKCRRMTIAWEVFQGTRHRNVVTWNSLLTGYVENGDNREALELFEIMDCKPNHVTYLAALKACTNLAVEKQKEMLQKGMDIHKGFKESAHASNTAVNNTLITMYSRCRDMATARDVFESMINKDVFTWTCLITGYMENGEQSRALELFWSMDCQPDHVVCIAATKACTGLAIRKASSEKEIILRTGMTIHRLVQQSSFDSNVLVNNALVDMYIKCGNMILARVTVDGMKQRDVVTWNVLIQGYVENRAFFEVLEVFTCMDCTPNNVTCLGVLKACTSLAKEKDPGFSLEKAKAIHERIRQLRLDRDSVIGNTLLEIYCKYGEMKLAAETFERMTQKNVVSWTCLMLGYVENGKSSEALKAFERMDCRPDRVSSIAALRTCIKLSSSSVSHERLLEIGVAVHKAVKDYELGTDAVLENTFLEMYRRCGNMELCKEQFERISCRNTVTWNCLMLGYVDSGEHSLALKTFSCMDCEANHITFLAALKACNGLSCGSSERLQEALTLHGKIKESPFASNVVLASSLVELYSKCSEMKKARDVFESVSSSSRDVVLWNSFMSGYVDNGDSLTALELFDCMDCRPNHVTYLAMLKACASLATEIPSERKICLKKGVVFHDKIKEEALDSNVAVSCSLIVMYSKCEAMHLAKEVFDEMKERSSVAWNCLLLGYVENRDSLTALDLLTRIDCQPDHLTLVAGLKACASLAGQMSKEQALWEGLTLHRHAKELGLDSNVLVASTLVDMYSKCGEVHLAREVFDGMIRKDVVTWNALMLGYVENKESSVALDLFTSMQCEATHATYLAVLKACARAGDEPFGRVIHGVVCKLGLEEDVVLSTALVDLYGSCGCIGVGQLVFDGMQSPALASWNALMGRYSSAGDVARVFVTARMAEESRTPLDSITFIHLLTACSHGGLVDKGKMYFELMNSHGIRPSVDHYNCMVDMLGRANRLAESFAVVKEMPEANVVSWMTLLGACRKWNNLEVGRLAYEAVVTKEKKHAAAAYVMMADIYRSHRLGNEIILEAT